jgi:hypothetical protein
MRPAAPVPRNVTGRAWRQDVEIIPSVRGDTESLVAGVVGDDLHGERVVSALVCATQRWYTNPAALFPYTSATGARGGSEPSDGEWRPRRTSVLAQASIGYISLPARKIERMWYLALTDTRVLIVSAERNTESRGRDWRATTNVLMPRGDVVVERFRRVGLTSWTLHLNVRTQGRWVLHSFSVIPGIGFRFAQARNIAEALGWQDDGRASPRSS